MSAEKCHAIERLRNSTEGLYDPNAAARKARKLLSHFCGPGELMQWEQLARRAASTNAYARRIRKRSQQGSWNGYAD